MNKLKDIFTTTDGIFTIFAAYFVSEFATLFDGFSDSVLNTFALLRHGNKNVIDGLNSDTKTDIICAVISVYLQQWTATAAAINADYNLNNTITRTKRGTIQKEIDNTDTATNYEKVYNDNEQTDTDKNISIKDGTQIDTYNTTETETKQMQVDSIEKIIRLRRQNLQIEIIDTICNNITKDIY